MNRVVVCLSAVFLWCVVSVPVVGAVPLTWNVSFSASSFVSATADLPPVDPVTGSFTITLDPTISVTNQTTGIVLHSLNLTQGSAVSYIFDSNINFLSIGGIADDGDTVISGADDFSLGIGGFSTPRASFGVFVYSQTSVGHPNVFTSFNPTGSISAVSQPVPEPASVLLMAAGLAGLGAWRFRVGTSQA